MGDTLTDLQILREARGLIDAPEKWGKGGYCVDSESGPRYCFGGALSFAATGDAGPRLMGLYFQHRLARLLGFEDRGDLIDWNDSPDRTHQEVLDRLDAWIRRLEELESER